MATDLGQLKYTLILDDEGLTSGLDDASAKVKESGDEMQGSMDKTTESSENLGSGFSGMMGQFIAAQAIFTLGQKALDFVTGAIKDGIQATKDWQTAQAQMQAGLKSTNDASGMTAEQLEGIAEGMQKVTPIAREATLTGENMLLTFTGIGKQVFPAATQAVADMATRMNGGAIPNMQQMSNTALQLGKALNDPATGMSMLKREGVTFDAQEQAQIKTMEAHNDTIGAQKIMLAELSKEFGGSAAASAKTYQGQIAMMKNQFNDLVGEGIDKAVAALQAIGVFLVEHKALLAAVGGAIVGLTIAIGVGLVAAVWAWVAANAALALTMGIIVIAGAVIGAIAYEVITHWTQIKAFFAGLISFFVGIWNGMKQGFSDVVNYVKGVWDGIVDFFKGIINAVKVPFNDFVTFLKDVAIVIMALLLLPLLPAALAWRAWHDQITAVFNDIVKVIVDVVKLWIAYLMLPITIVLLAWKAWHDQIIGFFVDAVNVVKGVWNTIVGFFGGIMNSIVNAIKAPVASFGSMLYNAGASLVSGLIKGIEDQIGAIVSTMGKVGNAVVNAAKSVLKIFSPSQVFSDIGTKVTLGLAQGITQGSKTAVAATQQVATSVIQAGSNMPSSAASVASTTNNNSSSSGGNNYNFAAGAVVLSTKDAVDEFFSIGNRNTALAGMGMAPLAGTTGV